jgi:fructokinase
MSKLISIGEILIDFVPQERNKKLKDILAFERVAGGAPANVAACVSKLGKDAYVLSKLGKDAFGEHLLDVLNSVGVHTSQIKRTSKANTGLAFVSLDETGNRDFSFYRNPSSDMLLEASEIDENLFDSGDILHFCSVDLIDAPVKKAHEKAIEYALKHDVLISFDPNVRKPLWDDLEAYKETINTFIPFAHILKVSDEELDFITGETDIKKALPQLLVGNVKVVLYTKGPDGAEAYTKTSSFDHEGFTVTVSDTTGSGDAFIGGVLYKLLEEEKTILDLENLDFEQILAFGNAVGAFTAQGKGAIPSMPNLKEVNDFKNR